MTITDSVLAVEGVPGIVWYLPRVGATWERGENKLNLTAPLDRHQALEIPPCHYSHIYK